VRHPPIEIHYLGHKKCNSWPVAYVHICEILGFHRDVDGTVYWDMLQWCTGGEGSNPPPPPPKNPTPPKNNPKKHLFEKTLKNSEI